MPVTQVIDSVGDVPATGETPTVFNFKAIALWEQFKSFIVPQMNTAFSQLNALETNVNAKEASTVGSSEVAVGAANYQGDWVADTYNKGVSVSVGSLRYISKIDGNTSTPPSANWLSIGTALSTSYDNSTSALTATDVQGAIDEVLAGNSIDAQLGLIYEGLA